MADDGNIRYLRYILLLGEGVLLVLRGIIRREVAKTSTSLEAVLTKPENRRLLEPKCSSRTQRRHLYPTDTTVNSDLDTWDISLLALVLLEQFLSYLSREERQNIRCLRDNRNEIQGHPPALSMDETDYATRAADLKAVLNSLASGLDKHTRDELSRIITNSSSVDFNYNAAINSLQKLYEFKEEMLQELGIVFETVNLRLDTIQAESKDHKQMTNDIRAEQSHMHANLLETKSFAEENNRIAHALSETVDVVKEETLRSREIDESNEERLRNIEKETLRSREIDESNEERLRNIEKMLNHMTQQGFLHANSQQDIDTNFNIKSDRQEAVAEAQNTMVTTVNDILKQIRPDVMEDSENAEAYAEAILQKVNELLTSCAGCDYELTIALLELIKDISRDGNILQARKGSVKLTIRFRSYEGCLHFIQYINSKKCQDGLKAISQALANRTGHAVSLSAGIAQESLLALHEHLEQECEKHRLTRTVILPVQCKGITNLSKIWNLLQKGGADKHMERLSEVLSKMVGGNVSVTTSVNLIQFEEALLKLDMQTIFRETEEREQKAIKEMVNRKEEHAVEFRRIVHKEMAEEWRNFEKEMQKIFIGSVEVERRASEEMIKEEEKHASEGGQTVHEVPEMQKIFIGSVEREGRANKDLIKEEEKHASGGGQAVHGDMKKKIKDTEKIERSAIIEIMEKWRRFETEMMEEWTHFERDMQKVFRRSAERERIAIKEIMKREERYAIECGQTVHKEMIGKWRRFKEEMMGEWSYYEREMMERRNHFEKEVLSSPEMTEEWRNFERVPGHVKKEKERCPANSSNTNMQQIFKESEEREPTAIKEMIERLSRHASELRLTFHEEMMKRWSRFENEMMEGRKDFEKVMQNIFRATEETERRAIKASKENVTKRPLMFKSKEKYSVEDKTDTTVPYIVKIEVLPGGRILLADRNNKRLKMLDSSFKCVSSCDLTNIPNDVCYTGNGRAMVSLDYAGILSVNVSDGLVIEQRHDRGHFCGLACNGETLYVTNGIGTVYTYTADIMGREVLYRKPRMRSVMPIAVSDDGERIYIGSSVIGLITIDNKGNHVSSLVNDKLMNITDLVVVGDGTVLVCCLSGDIVQVDYEGKKVLKYVLLTPNVIPSCLYFDRKCSRLIIGENYIHVYELQK